MTPGTRLLGFARRWFPASTVSSVFEPLVADWQRQWHDATPAQRRWIMVKGRVTFATTLVMMAPRLAPESRSIRARPLALAGSFWLLTSLLLPLLFFYQDTPRDLLWLLMPASLTVMLPFAILPAIDALRRDGEEPTSSDRRAALTLVVVAVLGVVVGQGWLTPAANQRWRNSVESERIGRPTVVWHGLREMTTSQLIAGEGSSIPRYSGNAERVRELNMRVTLAALPALLAWLRWRSLRRPRQRSWQVMRSCLLAIGAAAAFMAAIPASPALERIFFAPGFGPLLALGLFVVTTRTGIWLRQRAA